MTFWAKLLIVVVFILSLIFASMSAVLFGKREDFRAQLEKAKSDLRAGQRRVDAEERRD